MNKAQRTTVINFTVTVLIVAAANLNHPSPWYWIAWAVLVVLGIFNAITYRRSSDDYDQH